MNHDALPIDGLLDSITRVLEQTGRVVVVAPPGAGKTTAIPLALLRAGERTRAGRVLLLEPRRLAAQAAAHRMADLLHEPLGKRVGIRTRLETRVSPHTQIEVITEGVLTRMLIQDPGLEGVGTLLFDEFHERSLHADTGLALALECRDLFRPDLRLGILSATLDAEPVAELLGHDTPILRSEGRSFPVETRYRERPLPPPGVRTPGRPSWDGGVADTIREALAGGDGDVLVFLPGAREIRWVEAQLHDRIHDATVIIHRLHGSLPPEIQRAALAPAPPGMRKVILSSAVAETSLTISGVRAVVDGGWMRIPRFSPASGWTRLETVPVSMDSADQRRGRAGRTAPGRCYRLWTQEEERGRLRTRRAEIAEADLAPLLLDVSLWGTRPEALRWLTPPPQSSLTQARTTLEALSLLEPESDALTPVGRTVAEMGAHPRLGRMLWAAYSTGQLEAGCALASVLAERDVLRGMDGPPDADLRLRLEALRRGGPPLPGVQVDKGALARVRSDALQWRRRVLALLEPASDVAPGQGEDEDPGFLCALGWPDRIGRHTGGGRYQLASGRGVQLSEGESLTGSPWLVVLEVEDKPGNARILRAVPLDPARFETDLSELVREVVETRWNEEAQRVETVRIDRIGQLEVRCVPCRNPDPDLTASVLCEALKSLGLSALPWNPRSVAMRQRLAFLHHMNPETVASVDETTLLAEIDRWLLPLVPGARGLSCFSQVDLAEALLLRQPWDVRSRLEREAPAHWRVPSGSLIPIDYSNPDAPVLAVRIQEVFGLQTTPRIGGGSVPLTLHLLSPARRPVQVTRDLESFWRHGYFDVRKDLRGRYPKHFWPDNPLEAPATHRVRPPSPPTS